MVPTRTAIPTSTPVPSNTPTLTPTATVTPASIPVKVFFTTTRKIDNRVPPYNEAVSREISSSINPIVGVLNEYFKGPNAEEQSRGLVAMRNGFAGYGRIDFSNGVLNIYLTGYCQSNGTSYNIVQPLTATMKQFAGVSYVKIYDEFGRTRDPFGQVDSGPICLDATLVPTATLTLTPSHTPTITPSVTPTKTPVPTLTITPSTTPTRTPLPTSTVTPSETWTATPRPTTTLVPLLLQQIRHCQPRPLLRPAPRRRHHARPRQ